MKVDERQYLSWIVIGIESGDSRPYIHALTSQPSAGGSYPIDQLSWLLLPSSLWKKWQAECKSLFFLKSILTLCAHDLDFKSRKLLLGCVSLTWAQPPLTVLKKTLQGCEFLKLMQLLLTMYLGKHCSDVQNSHEVKLPLTTKTTYQLLPTTRT